MVYASENRILSVLTLLCLIFLCLGKKCCLNNWAGNLAFERFYQRTQGFNFIFFYQKAVCFIYDAPRRSGLTSFRDSQAVGMNIKKSKPGRRGELDHGGLLSVLGWFPLSLVPSETSLLYLCQRHSDWRGRSLHAVCRGPEGLRFGGESSVRIISLRTLWTGDGSTLIRSFCPWALSRGLSLSVLEKKCFRKQALY